MKKIFTFLLSLLFVVAFADPISKPLLDLLDVTHVAHQNTMDSIVEETQKKWLRPAGKERWEIPDLEGDTKEKIIPLAEELGFINAIYPESKHFDAAVILGATYQRMEDRLNYLIKLWDQGIRFSQVVFLTGQRPLSPAIEPISENYKTEAEAAVYLWKISKAPDELKQLPATFIAVPMKADGKRPTTKDTYEAWLYPKNFENWEFDKEAPQNSDLERVTIAEEQGTSEDQNFEEKATPSKINFRSSLGIKTDPEARHILLISNQPFCRYQQVLARSLLPEEFQIEMAGESVSKDEIQGSVLLDSVAQYLYYLNI